VFVGRFYCCIAILIAASLAVLFAASIALRLASASALFLNALPTLLEALARRQATAISE
jgi:hypothetical protein